MVQMQLCSTLLGEGNLVSEDQELGTELNTILMIGNVGEPELMSYNWTCSSL